MAHSVRWIDLLDPDAAELARESPVELHERALDLLTEPTDPRRLPRPTLEGHGPYVLGLFLVATPAPEGAGLVYQEVGLILTHDVVVTVRKTPPGCPPFEPKGLQERDAVESAGMVAYHLVDDVAERYLDLIDHLNGKIDEVEDNVEAWEPRRTRERLSELRHAILQIRRTLAPTRDAVHRVFDRRVDVQGEEVFDRDVELHFADAYDTLLRASEALELSRDLVAGVRDYYQAKIAIDQNEVTKKLTAIASILLVPTFIVGLYGQNFRSMPELHWHYGYAFSWALIVASTLVQLAIFRRLRWL